MYGTSNSKLYEEMGWVSLAERRDQAKLVYMYKIVNNLVPRYLNNIIPETSTAYNTRTVTNLPHFRARTDTFDKSFFPSATRLWNQLPIGIRNVDSLSKFKDKIKITVQQPIKQHELVYFGNRYLAVLHTRLRLGCSQLNEHLFRIGIKDSPKCICSNENEDVWHFFFVCPLFSIQRNKLHTSVTSIAPFTLETVLYGSPDGNHSQNSIIFQAVHEFIKDTSRFGNQN